VAEHRKQKPAHESDRDLARESRSEPGSRAAQAAARVAARYANAPSYSEMLAAEARAALLAAEAASQAARAAQAAAQSVLNSLEAAASAECPSAPMAAAPPFDASGAISADSRDAEAAYQVSELSDGQPYAIRWERKLPSRPAPARARLTASLFDAEAPAEDEEGFAVVEPAQPIPGNLLEFPRELIATRRVRPRRVEGPLAASARGAQLSIFEVDPGAISIDPETVHGPEEVTAPAWCAPEWSAPEWSRMRLDAHPVEVSPKEYVPEARSLPSLKLASASRRMLAAVVDASLVAGAFSLLALLVASKWAELPGVHAMEIGSALALVVAGALYETLFLSLARATPGMLYAQLRLCTFEGGPPTRAQRQARLVALLLSVLPMGLGLAWAIFDEEHLTWHDRLSRTYLRRI
jgi:uncharacterized RDD family membrane protein YckC